MSIRGYSTACELLKALEQRQLSCRELLEAHLQRVSERNPTLNAVVALDEAGARRRADEADAALARGERWGPLHGLPMTVKDTFEAVGFPCTAGVPAYRDHRPAQDAAAVAKLRQAGAVIFGKTNVPPLAGDFQTYNEVYGITSNPWDTARTPGGSAGGAAAALAAGLTALELGSDIGGSIRNPAHFCGVFGHKPSHGIVPTRGHVPPPPSAQAESDMGCAGPLARSVEDLSLALSVLAGPAERDAKGWQLSLPAPRAERLGDFRLAVWFEDSDAELDGEVSAVLQQALQRLSSAGAKPVEAKPAITLRESDTVFYQLMIGFMAAGLPEQQYEELCGMPPAAQPAAFDDLPSRFMQAATQRHREWLMSNEARARLRTAWDDFFRNYDALLCPVMPTAAFAHDLNPDLHARLVLVNGKPLSYMAQLRWTGLAAVACLPATVLPAGLTAQGLPVGLQVIAPYLEDRTGLRLAGEMEKVLGGFVAPPAFAERAAA